MTIKQPIWRKVEEKIKYCQSTNNGEECEDKAKYLIKDIICEDHKPFYVCRKCLIFFINKKDKKPHYKIVRMIK